MEKLQEEYNELSEKCDKLECDNEGLNYCTKELSEIIKKKLGLSPDDIICDIFNGVYDENKRFYDDVNVEEEETECEEEEGPC